MSCFVCMIKNYKWDVTCSLPPSPCHKLSHLLGPPPPSSVTYLMDGPISMHILLNFIIFDLLNLSYKITFLTSVYLELLLHKSTRVSKFFKPLPSPILLT